MKLRHRISRACWARRWNARSRAAVDRLDDGASDLEKAELAVALLWPLAREVFLMHRVDELSYTVIAMQLRIDVATVELCIADALRSIGAVRRGDPE